MYRELAEAVAVPMWAMSLGHAEEKAERPVPAAAAARESEALAAWTQRAMSANGFGDA